MLQIEIVRVVALVVVNEIEVEVLNCSGDPTEFTPAEEWYQNRLAEIEERLMWEHTLLAIAIALAN
jgi:hypothetical protein